MLAFSGSVPARLLLLALLAGGWQAIALPAMAAELVIRVVGLRSGEGIVHYAVYDRAETFPSRNGRLVKGELPTDPRGTTIRIDGMRPGTYAVAVYHDENGNGEFDQGFLGIPLEDYGFSNDASGFFGPPSFAAASFAIVEPRAEIEIDLRR